jgi:hypothetical protein
MVLMYYSEISEIEVVLNIMRQTLGIASYYYSELVLFDYLCKQVKKGSKYAP